MCFSRSRLISCVLCGESISSDEVLPNHLCSNCARKIPPHLASKFIGWNIYPPILFFICSLLLFSWGTYFLTPWMILPWPDFIGWDASSQSYLFLIGGLVCTILALHFPDLASRKYKSWLMKSSNLSEIEQALTENASNPQATLKKHATTPSFSHQHSRIFFLLLTFVFNGSLIGAFMLRNYPIYRETWIFTNFFGSEILGSSKIGLDFRLCLSFSFVSRAHLFHSDNGFPISTLLWSIVGNQSLS